MSEIDVVEIHDLHKFHNSQRLEWLKVGRRLGVCKDIRVKIYDMIEDNQWKEKGIPRP